MDTGMEINGKMDSEKEPQSLEEAFARLESLLSAMDRDDLPLEEAFARYEEGMKLLKYCSGTIDRVEKKVQVLSEDGVLEDFA